VSLFDIKAKYEQGKISKPDYIPQMYEFHKQLFDYARFIGNTDIASIEINDQGLLITSRKSGIKMLCTHPDRRIPPMEILNFGQYEERYDAVLRQLIRPHYTFLDIGANIGWYTVSFAQMSPHSRIFSFEPVPQTFQALTTNVQLNELTNVQAYNFGLSNQNENIVFYVNPEESIINSLRNISESPAIRELSCRVRRMDDVVDELKIKQIDFIKCDVEGAELFVFQGGLNTLRQHLPIVFAEMLRKWSARFGYHPNEMIQMFAEMGYRCFKVKGKKLEEFIKMDEQTIENNFFFLHTVKHADLIKQMVCLNDEE